MFNQKLLFFSTIPESRPETVDRAARRLQTRKREMLQIGDNCFNLSHTAELLDFYQTKSGLRIRSKPKNKQTTFAKLYFHPSMLLSFKTRLLKFSSSHNGKRIEATQNAFLNTVMMMVMMMMVMMIMMIMMMTVMLIKETMPAMSASYVLVFV